MSGSSDQPQHQLKGAEASGGGQSASSASFSWLSKHRQVLVFKTIEDALRSNPPRKDATFNNVVAAYKAVADTLLAAAAGVFNDSTLLELEQAVRNAGGVIAPGLKAQGDASISAFRLSTYGEIARRYDPAVVQSIEKALAIHLKRLKLEDLGQLFQSIAAFLNPVVSDDPNLPASAAFLSFDNRVKINVFLTLEDALLASPMRSEATFETVVNAFLVENNLLLLSQSGEFSENHLRRYQSSIELAGGKLYPDTLAKGDSSISNFVEDVFGGLAPILSDDVQGSAEACLNTLLKAQKPRDLSTLLRLVRTFYESFSDDFRNSPAVKVFLSFSDRRKIDAIKALEFAMASLGDCGHHLFQKSVRAVSAEISVLQAASEARLDVDTLRELLVAVVDCGGVISGGITANGAGSVGAFIDKLYGQIRKSLPSDVFEAANSALNVHLKLLSADNIPQLLESAEAFLEPLALSIYASAFEAIDVQPGLLDPQHTVEPNLASQTLVGLSEFSRTHGTHSVPDLAQPTPFRPNRAETIEAPADTTSYLVVPPSPESLEDSQTPEQVLPPAPRQLHAIADDRDAADRASIAEPLQELSDLQSSEFAGGPVVDEDSQLKKKILSA